MTLREHIPTLIAGVLALTSLWLVTQLRPGETQGPVLGEGPDFYLGRFTLLSMDEHGQPRQRIEAEGMQHLPAQAESRLQQPRYSWQPDSLTHWTASAEHGVISDDQQHLLLGGAVSLEGQGTDGPVQLQTRDLQVRPQQGLAETDQAVTLNTRQGRLTATGLRADLAQRQFHLLQNVRGRYEP